MIFYFDIQSDYLVSKSSKGKRLGLIRGLRHFKIWKQNYTLITYKIKTESNTKKYILV